MSKLKKLTVNGYKSIRSLTDFELKDLNVLIGANGSGKSNFITLFRLLAEMMEQNLQLYLQRQGGPDALLHYGRKETSRLHAEFYFNSNGYLFTLIPTNDNRLIFESESSWFGGIQWPVNKIASLGQGHAESRLKEANDNYSPYVRRAIASWRVYHFHDTSETARIKQPHATNDTLRLKPDAANLAAYLSHLRQQYPQHFEQITATIRLVAPFFGGFVQRPDSSQTIELEWYEQHDPDTPLKAHLLSDGTLRFICLATLLLQPWFLQPDTILIDEPELGLHPYAITLLAELFKRAAERKQLIVSTQSVELVNALEPADIIVVNRHNDESTFERLNQEDLIDWLEDYSLGDLWKQNIIGGRPTR